MQKLGEKLRELGQLQRSQPKNKRQLHRLACAAIAELSRLQDSARKAQKRFQSACLLYTSDAADDLTRVDLGGRRIIKKTKKTKNKKKINPKATTGTAPAQ